MNHLGILMAMFRHRLQLRRWAARVLLLWLFGIGASVANACLVTGQAAPVAATVGQGVGAMEAPLAEPAHDHAQAVVEALPSSAGQAPVHQGSFAKANCQDFCGKSTISIPPLKPAPDDTQLPAVMATAGATVMPVPATLPVRWWMPLRDDVQAPPIFVAFLRLAL